MHTYTAAQLLSPSHSAILDEIVLLIAHSFTEDIGTKYVFNKYTRGQHISALPAYFHFIVKAALLSGASVSVITKDEITSTVSVKSKPEPSFQQESIQLPANSQIRALGVLIPPSGNKTFESIWTLFRAGLLTLPFQCGFGTVYKLFTEIGEPMHALSDRIFPDPQDRFAFWHLLFLATHPDSQGQGLGKEILGELQGVVEQAEEGSKRPGVMYLESSSTGSQRLYRRCGFVDRDTAAYGRCIREGGGVVVEESGKVTGGRMFGMVWTS